MDVMALAAQFSDRKLRKFIFMKSEENKILIVGTDKLAGFSSLQNPEEILDIGQKLCMDQE